jgi:hypothetical protein
MADIDRHIGYLFTAELQFRLASAVSLATTHGMQPLDLPMQWSHGQHLVTYEEIALRPDQADYAAFFLQRSATLMMAVATRDAIVAAVPDPKSSVDPNVRSAYQIARLVRNAFAHGPLSPKWSIDPDCRDQVFSVTDVVSLNTRGLQGLPFDWRHYGGPLALFRLSQFVRTRILGHQPDDRRTVPLPRVRYYQQGDLILKYAEPGDVPASDVPVVVPPEGLELPGGHRIVPGSGSE